MSKPKMRKPVDMSLPPEDRQRRHRGRKAETPPALMGHGTNPRARRQSRDGERWLAIEARLREDAAGFAAEAGELDAEAAAGRMWQRVQDEAAGA